jgi:hypothetical protein
MGLRLFIEVILTIKMYPNNLIISVNTRVKLYGITEAD